MMVIFPKNKLGLYHRKVKVTEQMGHLMSKGFNFLHKYVLYEPLNLKVLNIKIN